jgi:hypothetical protein
MKKDRVDAPAYFPADNETGTLSNPGSTWHAIGTGEDNGDGRSDIQFQNSDATRWCGP